MEQKKNVVRMHFSCSEASIILCLRSSICYIVLIIQIGAIYLWSYVYNIVRISSSKIEKITTDQEEAEEEETSKLLSLPIKSCDNVYEDQLRSLPYRIKQCLSMVISKINLKAIFAPSTTGAMVGFIVGITPPLRKLLIGSSAPLRVIQDSAYMLGNAAIPSVTLIMGGNLLKGLKGRSGIKLSLIFGIIVVRYILLPILGIVIVKGAIHFGLVHSDPLYQFVLLLQYALPPAMNMGTITQLFGAGESECSVIMLWTYALASLSLTLWSTFFMWLVVPAAA